MDNKIKVFVSQPMSDLPEDEVQRVFRDACETIYNILFKEKGITKCNVEIISTYYDERAKEAENYKYPSLIRLANAYEKMANVDYMYFVGDWESKRGCIAEYVVAKMYNIPVLNNYTDQKFTAGYELIV